MATIVLYWSNIPEKSGFDNHHDWRTSELKFSPFHDLVFKSHYRVGNTVELWTHQQVTDFPYENITIKDANEIIPSQDVFDSLSSGHSIAFVSDAVRLKRASQILGIVLDMDCVCLRPFPAYESWFSTMPSKKTSGFAPKWGPNKPPFTVHDGSWNGKELAIFPIKVAKTTQHQISDLSDMIINKLHNKPKGTSNEWNSILWTVKAIANSDTTAKIFEPLYNCPLPAWLGEGKCYSIESPTRLTGNTTLFGHRLPSIDDIFDNSYCIAHFFESAWNKADVISDQTWNHIPLDSLLYQECKLIYTDCELMGDGIVPII
jgi:hypothetical protein